MPVPLGRNHGGDILGCMETGELIRSRRRTVHETTIVEQVQSADEIHHRRHPLNRQRVFHAITGFPIDLAADQDRLRRKGGRDRGVKPGAHWGDYTALPAF